jgi:hypothetical protein
MHTNAGVMVLNVTSAIHEWRNEFDDFVMSQIVKFNGHAVSAGGSSSSSSVTKVEVNKFNDQTAFHQFFPIRLSELTLWDKFQMFFCCKTYFQTLFTKYYSNVLPKKFEWEPYLGPNEEEAVIVHWHGIKFKYQDDCGSIFNHQFTHPDNVKLFAMANLTETEAQRLALLSEDEFAALSSSSSGNSYNAQSGHIQSYTHSNRQLLSFYEKLDQHPELTSSGFRIQTIRFFRYLNILCNRVDLKNRRTALEVTETKKMLTEHEMTPSTASSSGKAQSMLRKVV